MRLYYIPVLFVLIATSTLKSHAQISNSNNPHPSAAVDITATNKGLLLPRVALTGTADVTTIPAPATSLVVYHTTTVAGMPEGFYYWNGTRWESLSNEAVTHAFASAVNTLTSTVNGVQKTAPIINTNALNLTGTNLTSTVNGKASAALNLASIVPATTNLLTSTGNVLTSNVNNVPKTAPIINSNALTLSGTNLTSTVNGVTSPALSLAGLAGWSLAGNAGTAAANFLGTTDNQPLRFRTNNTEKMTITAAGNVGIGNTAPTAPLHFSTGVANRKIVLFDNKNNDHEFYGFGISSGMLRSHINASTAAFGWFSGVNDTTSNEIMKLGGNGALSLGTAAGTATMTGARLDVAKGEVRFRDLLSNGVATDSLVTITSSGYLKKRAIGSMAWGLTGNTATATDYIGTKATVNPFIIKTSSAATGAGATPTERMRIDKDGVVTIGNVAGSRLAFNTEPDATTDINSRRVVLHLGANDHQYRGFGIYSNLLVSQVDATGADFLWRAGANATTSNELMKLRGNGALSLGTAAGTATLTGARLDVAKGQVRFQDLLSDGVATDNLVTITSSGYLKKRAIGSMAWGLTGNTATATDYIGTKATVNPFIIKTSSAATGAGATPTERMRIDKDGVVTIGNVAGSRLAFNTAPATTDINSRRVVLHLGANDHQYRGFGIYSNMLVSQVDATAANFLWRAGANDTTSNELMRLTGTGNLGLGIAAPTQKLHVVGKAIITAMDTGAAADQVVTVDAAGLLKKRTLASVVPPTTNALALNGTNLTSTVNGVTSNTLSLAGLAGWSLAGNAGTAAANFLGTTDNQPLRFRTNNTEKMTILGNGNVGIGTTAPAYGLHVQSTAAAGYVAQFSNSTNVHGAVYVRDTNDGNTGIAGSYFGTRTNHGTNIMTNAISRIAITNAGRVGIGHNAPTYTLDVVSTTNDELLASFLPQNKTEGIAIGFSGISKIASTANSDLKISPKGTGKVNIDGPALIKTLPAGTVGEQVVVVDGSNNLKKIAAASVGKTYVTRATTTAAVTSATSGITTTATVQNTGAYWNANQLQGRTVAATTPAAGQILRYDGSQWQPYTTATYSPTLVGNLGTGQTLPANNAHVWTRAQITLPANSKYIITVNMLATSHPNRAPNNSYVWIRSWFSNSSTNSTPTGDKIGGGLVSGNITANSLYTMVNGTVILHNSSNAAKTYYYWAHTDDRFGNPNVFNSFGRITDGENQMFAVPIDN
ncbi:beta strand repeat-containing protein [Flavobacterium kingsejongi]|uniref:Uncharacterized protein n=1 Tax=Flavobacterium kingsejongi TaxID=1678728 RepID=A0A2S1LLC0_9FLAO|nr:hypothetical protein [Flavobacterium kingsejongi]AWG24481.1 hypothetical protein FK004_04140 [Flavobacterium kingsejongi]